MIYITSSSNSIVKEIKSLKEKKYRELKGMFFIEGLRFVEEALDQKNLEIDKILVSEEFVKSDMGKTMLEKVEKLGITIHGFSDKVFKEMSDTITPQGIMGVLRINEQNFIDFYKKGGFYVILDGIKDPGNMGTIIRTAHAAGVNVILVSKGCVDVYNPKVLRSTMGSIFHVPVCIEDNIIDTIKVMKENEIMICTSHIDGSKNYFEVDYKNGVAIVIGSEANGVCSEIRDISDVLVKIPMPGKSESLNASVAAGILIYEVLKSRL